MSISIQQISTDETQSIYTVNFFNTPIHTTVTDTASAVESWLSSIYNIHRSRLRRLIVGLDVEWRPNRQRNVINPVALLQLCVGHRCLIFQIIHADYIPQMLRDFLVDPKFRFVGVGIADDVEKLLEDYELSVGRTVDLRVVAAENFNAAELRRAGIKTLAAAVLGVHVEKPRKIQTSRWDSSWLSIQQVQYACLDAFLSFEIGMNVIFGN